MAARTPMILRKVEAPADAANMAIMGIPSWARHMSMASCTESLWMMKRNGRICGWPKLKVNQCGIITIDLEA
jgi:hypothetical protein